MTLKHYDISDDEVSERAIEIGTIEDVDRYLLSLDEDE